MTEPKDNKSFLEKSLNLFAEVRTGEGLKVMLLTLNLFLVLTSYYIIKVVREPLILTGGGAEMKAYLSVGTLLLILIAVRLYARLAGKFARRNLINTVNIFFAVCMVLFYFMATMEVKSLGIIFFLWVGMFNVMVVAQCWSFANDVYTAEQGKRLFAIVAFGASAGAVLGSALPTALIALVGLYPMMLLASGVLLSSLIITNYVDSKERPAVQAETTETDKEAEQKDEGVGRSGAFELLFRNKYLLMIAFLILLLNWVNTNGEYILSRTVERAAVEKVAESGGSLDDKAFIGQFYGAFYTGVNIAGVLIQLFLVSRILKYLGMRVALMILPLIALGGNLILAFYPLLGIVRWTKTAENSTDYSLNNTVRHALFLPTSREEKYKAKQAIDSFFHRAGDVLSAPLVFIGVNWLAFETSSFALFNVALIIFWLILAYKIGLENKRLVAQKQSETK